MEHVYSSLQMDTLLNFVALHTNEYLSELRNVGALSAWKSIALTLNNMPGPHNHTAIQWLVEWISLKRVAVLKPPNSRNILERRAVELVSEDEQNAIRRLQRPSLASGSAWSRPRVFTEPETRTSNTSTYSFRMETLVPESDDPMGAYYSSPYLSQQYEPGRPLGNESRPNLQNPHGFFPIHNPAVNVSIRSASHSVQSSLPRELQEAWMTTQNTGNPLALRNTNRTATCSCPMPMHHDNEDEASLDNNSNLASTSSQVTLWSLPEESQRAERDS